MKKFLIYFFLLVLLWNLTPHNSYAQNKAELYYLKSAYNTFYKEEDQASLMLWSKRVIPKHYDNIEIIRMLANIPVLFKNRTMLRNVFTQLWRLNKCLNKNNKTICSSLKQLWVNEYSNIKFDKLSNSKIIDLRNSIKTKQCKKAQGLISQIQKTESDFKDLLELKTAYLKNCSIKANPVEIRRSTVNYKNFLSI